MNPESAKLFSNWNEKIDVLKHFDGYGLGFRWMMNADQSGMLNIIRGVPDFGNFPNITGRTRLEISVTNLYRNWF